MWIAGWHPLVNKRITMENHHYEWKKISYEWLCSIVFSMFSRPGHRWVTVATVVTPASGAPRCLHWIGCWQKAPAAHIPERRRWSRGFSAAATSEPWRWRKEWIWGGIPRHSHSPDGKVSITIEAVGIHSSIWGLLGICMAILWIYMVSYGFFGGVLMGELRGNHWKLNQQTLGFRVQMNGWNHEN